MKTQRIIKIAAIILHGEKNITLEQVEESIDMAISLRPEWAEEVDRVAVRTELTRRFSYFLAA